jgi:hypothetical protein
MSGGLSVPGCADVGPFRSTHRIERENVDWLRRRRGNRDVHDPTGPGEGDVEATRVNTAAVYKAEQVVVIIK